MPGESFLRYFPHLQRTGYAVTSPIDANYNCIAWAAGDVDRWWWPNPDGYWPEDVPREETLEAFIAVYERFGYGVCDDGKVEEGFEKLAIYAVNDVPTHAARQLSDGTWTSKLGEDHDISHFLPDGLFSATYGRVAVWMKRNRADRP